MNLDQTYCEGDGCIYFDRCPKAYNSRVKEAFLAKGRMVSLFRDPLKLSCWRDTPVSLQEAEEAIDRIDPKGREQLPEEPEWD